MNKQRDLDKQPSLDKQPNNFQEHIHNPLYYKKFEKKAVGPDSFMADRFRERELLDGQWHFCHDIYDTARRHNWFEGKQTNEHGQAMPWDFDFDYWDEVRVPSVWNTTDERYRYYEGTAVYTRTFLWETGDEARVMLKVGAAYHNSTVFINDQQVGYHLGGDTPYYMDVTGVLQKENRIMIAVDNKRSFDRIPTYCTDWYNYGGLYRSVELFRLPETYIREFSLSLSEGSRESVCMKAALSDNKTLEGLLSVPELGIEEKVSFTDGCAEMTLNSRPELWSPENPRLYEVQITAGRDVLKEKIGFRSIAVRGTEILLNGQSLKLRGISCHEESVLNGKAVTEEEIRENFSIAKELGCNFMRLAHYPHTEKAARIADEVGLLLWEEVPVYWSIQFGNPLVLANARQQLTELIKRDINRASVIIWSVGNENPDTDDRLSFMSNLASLCRELDDTRLVSAACLVDDVNNRIDDRLSDSLDVIGINEYYGWYDPYFPKLEEFFRNSDPGKPVIITETGGGALSGHHGSKSEMFTEEHQEALYKEQVRCINEAPYVAGLSPWILFDFRTPVRLNRFQKDYNRKGLLSEDKKHRKLAFYVLQEFYSRWRVLRD